MTGRDDIILEITPQVLLKAYAVGIFPMDESAVDPGLYWIEPEARGSIPLERFHVPRRLARTVAQDIFEVRVDNDFSAVIAGCAAVAGGRAKTWINARIRRLYYGAADPKGGAVENGVRFFASPTCHHRPEIYGGIGEAEAAMLLKDFFRDRR